MLSQPVWGFTPIQRRDQTVKTFLYWFCVHAQKRSFLFLPSASSQTADLHKYKHHQVWLELHGAELESVISFLSGFCHLSTRWQQIIINNMSHVWSIPFKLWRSSESLLTGLLVWLKQERPLYSNMVEQRGCFHKLQTCSCVLFIHWL